MSLVRTSALDTYYELDGDAGTPFVLVCGLGSHLADWDVELRAALAERHRCLVFDNRGVGRSGMPEGPYTIEQFAGDTLALLDALALERVHLLGASMGGLIVQEVALQAPERLLSLSLCCTFPGLTHFQPPEPQVLQTLHESGYMEPGAGVRNNWPINYLPDFIKREREFLEAKLQRIIEFPCAEDAHEWHFAAAGTWDRADLLRDMRVPTLVMTGEDDVLIPPENSRTLMEMLPNARLRTYPNAGHGVLSEQRAAAAADLLAHAARHESAAG